ncbi:MAG: cytochrome C [Deltaproteobacteria bacterium]|nr:cytochrome C [Deltaproteobacteria bacterium]
MTHVPDETLPDRLETWPHLVRIELLWTLAALVVLTVWSIVLDAPLESPANPTLTPDPSKAPWYFLGLQELLVYFDPWIAGVAFPLLIIFGLMIIPYVDVNVKGSGYFCIRERPLAISVFLFGFLGLWVLPILIGTFCRGPGWLWYWPWEPWDVPKVVSMTNRNLSDLFGVPNGPGALLVGAVAVGIWYGSPLVYYVRRRSTPALVQLGRVRFAIVAFLLMTMVGIPVKMALRIALNVKYVWVTPWFNV